jgi:hypothetical protein
MKLLRDVWLAHVLKRAIAEVNQASVEDYQMFGLDRDGLLARLRALRDMQQNAARSRGAPLSIPIARWSPQTTCSADLEQAVVG